MKNSRTSSLSDWHLRLKINVGAELIVLAIARDMPSNTHFGVQPEFCGAGLGGQAIKTRWTFVSGTLQVEEKAA